MASIFEGLTSWYDTCLGLSETWPGAAPRYQHTATLQRLARENARCPNGELLVENMCETFTNNWSGQPCRGQQNWRFAKQLALGDDNPSAEVTLERTIANITDENWVNQVPTASGIDYSGPHHLDLVHRTGTEFTFVELKVGANTPLSAAFQILQYGLLYGFSRRHAEGLGYNADQLEILRADQVHLRVLAPAEYYPQDCLEWLKEFEWSLNAGLSAIGDSLPHSPATFKFEAFPEGFEWNPTTWRDESVRKDLLWALHRRAPLFQP